VRTVALAPLAVSLAVSFVTPPPAAADESLVLRFAVVVGTRAGAVRDFAQVLDYAQMSDYLSSWDPNADNPEIRELFALKGLSEVTRQVAIVPASGGTVAGGAKVGAHTWKVELDVRPIAKESTVDLRIFRDGVLHSAPSVRDEYGGRAIVSVTGDAGEQHFFVVQVDRRGTAGQAAASDAHPKLLHRVNPEYPASEKASRVEGLVVALLRVEIDGRVGDARIERGLGAAFDTAALEAVRQWRFEPARRDGNAVTADYRVTIRFVPGPAADS
jgi:TonB family protein